MNTPPLHLFLTSLTTDGIYVTSRDYDRLILLLRTGGQWDLARLRDTLLALLAKDEEQQELILHRFDDFFTTDLEIAKELAGIGVTEVLSDLAQVSQSDSPVIPVPQPEPIPPAPSVITPSTPQ